MAEREKHSVNGRAFLREVLELVCTRPVVELDKLNSFIVNPDVRPREPFKSLLNNRQTQEPLLEDSDHVIEDLTASVENLFVPSLVWTRSDLISSPIEPHPVQTCPPDDPLIEFPCLPEEASKEKKKKKKPRWRNTRKNASSISEDTKSSSTVDLNVTIESEAETTQNVAGAEPSRSRQPNETPTRTRETNDASSAKSKKAQKKSQKKAKETFVPYETESQVEAGLLNGTHIKGEIRINARNTKEAYITDQSGSDILIQGVGNRNAALDGDVVVVKLDDESKWISRSSEEIQRTGKVVFIREKVHNRVCIGTLRIDFKRRKMNTLKVREAEVLPADARNPCVLLDLEKDSVLKTVLLALFDNPKESWDDCLVHCQILEFVDPKFALGSLVEILGKKGNIEVETVAAFRSHGLDDRRLSKDILSPRELELLTTTDEEISRRLDLRKSCIFSIDPPTARDLDDALSIKKLEDDLYEVGVHISDVAHYIEYGSCLDCEVARRATSTYLVDSVIHMLPVELCLHCSLLPGEDKLAFSVIWKMDGEGNILDTMIAKTVVNSCAQLSYDHAQALIDGVTPNLPKIYNGFMESDIKEAVLNLHRISRNMLRRRFENGSLKINQPKTLVKLDENRTPVDVFVYEIKESNSLIEEFMLRANQTVAEKINAAFPDLALLRRHSPPKQSMIDRMIPRLKKLGIPFSASSSFEFNASLIKAQKEDIDRALVLTNWCAKTMKRAEYFCCEKYMHHYALCFDLYTHFTSPIRRYADVVVHRLLAAAIGYSPMPDWDTAVIRKHAETSNTKKLMAKKMGDDHVRLYVAEYVRISGPIEAEGVVYQVNKNCSLDVYVKKFGFVAHVYACEIDGTASYDEEDGLSLISIAWKAYPEEPVVLKIFSPVRLKLTVDEPNSLTISAKLIR